MDERKSSRRLGPPDARTLAAMGACVEHARDLIAAAKAVEQAGKHNIAFHLAILALEEIGRRELIKVEWIASKEVIPPAWPEKNMQDHTKKLFWCFFGGTFTSEKISKEKIEEISGLANRLHSQRLAGLYVGQSRGELSIPKEAVSIENAIEIIKFADISLKIAEETTPSGSISEAAADNQAWFLEATSHPDKLAKILSGASLTKLAELQNASSWVIWLREIFEKDEKESRALVQLELERGRNLPKKGTKDKWRLKVRIVCASHSIRPGNLKAWNKINTWIKLVAVSGRKNELIVEFTLGDNVPVNALWHFGWGLARHFVVALNIGTMGFFWWRMPEQISRYYENITDLESGRELAVERSPILKIDWGENRVLTEEDLLRVLACFSALKKPNQREGMDAHDYYIGGLTFLSLNDIHWQCELQAFGNFYKCLRELMTRWNDLKDGEPFEISFTRFLDKFFEGIEDKGRFIQICQAFEIDKPEDLTITLREVSFMKFFCDLYFLYKIRPDNGVADAPAATDAQQQ